MSKDKLFKFKGGRRLSIISLFLFLSFVFCPLSSVTADQIRIRTIITPVGSQSEKWGAKGLMVCIGGETIPNGGCGFGVNTGIDASGNPVDFEADDVVIFEDKSPEDHEYTAGVDTIYAVRGVSPASLCPTPYIVFNAGTGKKCATACANAGHSCAFGQYYGALGDIYHIINCSYKVSNPAHVAYCACCND